jgi:hypothetical protein
MFFCVFFAFEKVSIHVAISCPTIHNDNLTHCYQFIPISILVLLIYTKFSIIMLIIQMFIHSCLSDKFSNLQWFCFKKRYVGVVFLCFFAFEKVSIHVAISCPTIHNDNLTHCYQFIPISYSSIVLVLLIYTILSILDHQRCHPHCCLVYLQVISSDTGTLFRHLAVSVLQHVQ